MRLLFTASAALGLLATSPAIAEEKRLDELTVAEVSRVLGAWGLDAAFGRAFARRRYDGLTLARFLSLEDLRQEWTAVDCEGSQAPSSRGSDLCEADHTHFTRLQFYLDKVQRAAGSLVEVPSIDQEEHQEVQVDVTVNVQNADQGRAAGRRLSSSSGGTGPGLSGIHVRKNNSALIFGQARDVSLERTAEKELTVRNDLVVEGAVTVGECELDACALNGAVAELADALDDAAFGQASSFAAATAQDTPDSCFEVWARAYDQYSGAYFPPNGVYILENENGTTRDAFCDIHRGGWELALRVMDSVDSEFHFESAYWENSALLNAQDFDPADTSTDAKYATFAVAPVGHMRGCFAGSTRFDRCVEHALPAEFDSLTHLFSTVTQGVDGVAGGITFSNLTEAEHYRWLDGMGQDKDVCSHTISWWAAGINLDDTTSSWDCKVRFGMLENNEDSINTANNAFGFGAVHASNDGVAAGVSCHPDTEIPEAGTMWVQPAHDPVVFPASCFDILQQRNPAAPNGVYDLTNPRTNATYRAYCDMDNGGWELALRVGSSDSEFVYASAYWENTDLLNGADFDPDKDADAKYATFANAAAGYLRGCFGSRTAGSCNTHVLPAEYSSLTTMFKTVVDGVDGVAGGVTFTDLTEEEHYQWLVNMGLDTDVCDHEINWYAAGINLVDTDSSAYDAKVRFGFMENNQDSIYTANNAFGFGAEEANGFGVGAGATCYPGESYSTPMKGSIWVLPLHAVPTQGLFARAQNGVHYG